MKLTGLFALFLFTQQVFSAVLGIDYGEEFIKGALVGPNVNFDIILTVDSKRKDASGLAITEVPGSKSSVQRSYGSGAISTCVKQPKSCLMNLKSLLGKPFEDRSVAKYQQRHPGVNIVDSASKRNTVDFKIGSNSYPTEELLAMNFEDLKVRAEEHLSLAVSSGNYLAVDDAIISVPGYFNQAQRSAIIDAAEIAGLNVLGLVDDGIAVALNYASSRTFEESKQYHLIYDMGAGSTKATLVSFLQNGTTTNVEEEGYGFDEELGGQLFTQSIKDLLISKFLAKYPKIKESKLLENHKAMNRLWQSSEKAKSVLSANVDTYVSIESFFDDIDFKVTITREEFEEYNSAHMERITKPILDALSNSAGIEIGNLSSVILAGGSTRVPFVQRHLNTLVGSEIISKNVNADEAVVMGATLRGVQLAGILRNKDINLIEKSGKRFSLKYEAEDVFHDQSVFSPKTTIPKTGYVELQEETNLYDEEFGIELYENGQMFTHMKINTGKKFNSTTCPGGLKFAAKLTVDSNKFFTLNDVSALCFPNVELTDEIIAEYGLDGDTISEEAMDKILKPETTVLKPKNLKYATYKPMSSSVKQQSISKLRDLAKEDLKRSIRSETINNLEGSLYNLRGYIDDEDVSANGPPMLIETAREKITEYLEWLEYELDDSVKLKDIEDKYDEIRIMKIRIDSYLKIGDSLLTREEMTKLAEKIGKSMYDIQEFMLTMSEDAESIRKNFTMANVNFEEASKSIKLRNVDEVKDSDISELFESLNIILDELEPKLEDPEAFEEFAKEREQLFRRREVLTDKAEKLDKILKNLKSMHKQRIGTLNSHLTKTLRKRERKANKAAEKEAAESEVDTEGSTESASTSTESNVHDEL